MKIFRRLFSKKEPPSKHTLVANELRFLVCDVLVRRGIVTKERIVRETDCDSMEWFRIRPREYGESGSHYGIPEIIGHPGEDNPLWPSWLKLIPTSQLKDVWLELSNLAQERCPLGGHLMDEENLRRAVCEFADTLFFRLYEAEKQARL
jgi:hypothetical protein